MLGLIVAFAVWVVSLVVVWPAFHLFYLRELEAGEALTKSYALARANTSVFARFAGFIVLCTLAYWIVCMVVLTATSASSAGGIVVVMILLFALFFPIFAVWSLFLDYMCRHCLGMPINPVGSQGQEAATHDA